MKGLIFTYLLTYGGAVVALFNPFVGLLIYVCFAILRPESLWHWSVPEGNYSRVVALALLAGWAGKGFGNWRLGRGAAVTAMLAAFWLWAVLGTFIARDQDVASHFVESQAKIVLPFLVGITTIETVRQLKQLAWVILLSQGYVALECNLTYYSGFNAVHEMGFGGMDNNCVAISMVTCIGLAFFLGLGTGKWWLKLLALGAAGLMGHVVLFSFSRGGMLALIVTAVMAFLLIPKQPKHFVVLALAIVVGLRLAGSEVQQRFGTVFADSDGRDASAQSRLDLWAGCWDAMLKRPITGVGPDHWPLIVAEYGWPPGKEAHTLWLQLGAELGFPGLTFLLLFYGLCAVRLWPLTRKQVPVPDPWFRDGARMVLASLTGFLVSAQFVTLKGLEVPFYITLLGAGMLKLASVPAASPDTTPEPAAGYPEWALPLHEAATVQGPGQAL